MKVFRERRLPNTKPDARPIDNRRPPHERCHGAAPAGCQGGLASRWIAAAAASAAAATATTATPKAEAAVTKARITYEAPHGCPDEDAFLRAVRAQMSASEATAVSDDEDSEGRTRKLSIRIVGEGGELRGHLRIDEIDGATSAREVTGRTCDEVAAALSLFAAMAVDAGPAPPATPPKRGAVRKRTEHGAEGTGTAGAPQDGDASATPFARGTPGAKREKATARIRPGAREVSAEAEEERADAADAASPPDAPTAPHVLARIEIGAQVGVFGAVAPRLAWGAAPFLDLSVRDAGGFAYSLRLGAAFAQSAPVVVEGGTATFHWTAARASGCPGALLLGSLIARPCGGVDLGLLRGFGSGVTRPLQQTRTWIAATLQGRLQLRLAYGMILEAEAGASIPFVRDTFVFEQPARLIHRVPPVSAFMTGGYGVILP